MTEHNHRRGTSRKRYPKLADREFVTAMRDRDPEAFTTLEAAVPLHNGYRPRNGKPWGYIDKSLHAWGRRSELADRTFGALIGNDFHRGDRGMAKAVRGAKKFVRSRFRFHENTETRRLADSTIAEN
ncbi:hypothetical protein G6L37_06990 [Agrobacterium rubi]|nr:hypothetical protein [Agrobacterium rubi]NTF25111.1 hypothetical protein [Agrobacterium rubi]